MDSENQRRGPGRPPKPRTDATAELLAQLEGTAATVVEPEAPVAEEPPVAPQPASDDPLADIPRDGRAVMLIDPKGGAVKAYWRETRHFHNGAWQSRAFWAHWRGPDPVQFEPCAWGEAQ